jgi:Mg-chelatase subunit ChlD
MIELLKMTKPTRRFDMILEKIQERALSPRTQEQLIIMAMDGSGSMDDQDGKGQKKAQASGQATKECIKRCSRSSRKDELFFSEVVFDHNVEVRLAPTLVSQIDDSLDTNPLTNHGGETAIGDGMKVAQQIGEDFLKNEQEGLPRNVVIIVMSDGQNNRGMDPRAVAKEIKQNERVTIVSAAYGKDADKNLLKEIASDPDEYYSEPQSGSELRDYFLASIESVQQV